MSKFKELSSNSLNSVAKEELKDEKVVVENFESVWMTDLPKLIERCRKDVELVIKIDNTCELFDGCNSVHGGGRSFFREAEDSGAAVGFDGWGGNGCCCRQHNGIQAGADSDDHNSQ